MFNVAQTMHLPHTQGNPLYLESLKHYSGAKLFDPVLTQGFSQSILNKTDLWTVGVF